MKHILTAEDMEIAKLLNDGKSSEYIAKQLGLAKKTIDRRKKWPEMAEFIDAVRSGRRKALAGLSPEKVEAKAAKETEKYIAKVGLTSITSVMIVARLWELAQLSPDATRGNILGQQQALDSIWDKLGFKGDAPQIGQGEGELAKPSFYKSEWRQ
jgi:hypothetical protein